MDREKLLRKAYIPKELWSKCYISKDEMIFTPHFTEEDVIDKTGQEVYNEWITTVNSI